VEPEEIFQLLIKADERVKYATDARATQRRDQARELLEQARTEAQAIGNQQLVEQAERRLADLRTIEAEAAEEADPPA
jgi:hypothetical protein